MPSPQETEMDAVEIIRLYNGGRRDFSNLKFVNYLDFRCVDLSGIIFRNCWFDGNFCDSNLESADFSNSCIKPVDFCRTNLKNAVFRGAGIDAALFEDVVLGGADFSGATSHCYTYSAGELPDTVTSSNQDDEE